VSEGPTAELWALLNARIRGTKSPLSLAHSFRQQAEEYSGTSFINQILLDADRYWMPN
jgi:hypothetical protein